jgi:hypothetical protein
MGFLGARSALERRRDPRLAPKGAVRLAAVHASGGDHDGHLVDVSARGVRLRVPDPVGLEVEDAVRVEIRLEPRDSPTGGRVQLTGRGKVVRLADAPSGEHEVAVLFDAPLAFLEQFPAIRVF